MGCIKGITNVYLVSFLKVDLLHFPWKIQRYFTDEEDSLFAPVCSSNTCLSVVGYLDLEGQLDEC